MRETSFTNQPDFINQLLDSRFHVSENAKPISDDFYIDLLCVFHDPDRFNAEDFQVYPIASILTYLKHTHKLYLSKSLGEITNSIENLALSDKAFEKLQPSLDLFFQKFREELEEHIREEEEHLFLYIEAMLQSEDGQKLNAKNQLANFLLHHDDTHEKDLKGLVLALTNTDAYQDSFAFRMLVNRLSIFELDLRIHAKMEEEVLMPLALKLEKDILGITSN